MPLLPDIQKAKFPISIQLLTHTGRVTGPILRFFRKAIGLTADEFATLIGTTRVEVSRWENGHVQMSGLRELQVRLEIADKLLPSGPEAARIREEVIMVMTRRYDPSAHVEGIEVDARHCYPQGTDAPPVQDEVAVYT
jgi:transcriptional regulator with XRE-family HTH domain